MSVAKLLQMNTFRAASITLTNIPKLCVGTEENHTSEGGFGFIRLRCQPNASLLVGIWLWNCKKYNDNWRIKNQLDATYYFIVLLIGSTCFGHYYAHHQELATMMLITTLVDSFLVCCRLEVSLQPGHNSSLTAPNLQHTANKERNDQCGNQHHSRELLMMGIAIPETCWAYKKYNKVISDI